MKRIVSTALTVAAAAGALALTAAPAVAQFHQYRSGGYHSYGYRGGYSGGYRGGYSGGYYGGYRGYRGGYGGWGFGLSLGSPGYYSYPYYGYNNCYAWSPYYGRYVVRPGCYDYGYNYYGY